MEEIAKIVVEEFEKKPDGSWVCTKNSDITTKSQMVIRLTPGMVFRKGFPMCGIDVAEALDQASAN